MPLGVSDSGSFSLSAYLRQLSQISEATAKSVLDVMESNRDKVRGAQATYQIYRCYLFWCASKLRRQPNLAHEKKTAFLLNITNRIAELTEWIVSLSKEQTGYEDDIAKKRLETAALSIDLKNSHKEAMQRVSTLSQKMPDNEKIHPYATTSLKAKLEPKGVKRVKKEPAGRSLSVSSPSFFTGPQATVNRSLPDFAQHSENSPNAEQPLVLQQVSVESVLQWVATGEIHKVRNALENDKEKNNGSCGLLDLVGDTTKEDNGEIFKKMTIWQLALRESDSAMCNLILMYFTDRRSAGQQMLDLKQNKRLIKRYGSAFFDLQPTIDAYKKLQKNWHSWSPDERSKHWCENIGKCQRHWPAWLRYEITQFGTDALWCQKKVRAKPVKRELRVPGMDTNYSWMRGFENKHELGGKFEATHDCDIGFAWLRANWKMAHSFSKLSSSTKVNLEQIEHDLECLCKEQDMINAYRKELDELFQRVPIVSPNHKTVNPSSMSQSSTPAAVERGSTRLTKKSTKTNPLASSQPESFSKDQSISAAKKERKKIDSLSFFTSPAAEKKENLSDYEQIKQRSAKMKVDFNINDQSITAILDRVLRGEIEAVKAELQRSCENHGGDCALLHIQGDTTKTEDNENFKQVTVWQLAQRESDIGMCKMIVRFFSQKNHAVEQINALKSDKEFIRVHGSSFFDLQTTIKAYRELQNNWKNWTHQERNRYWCRTIGSLQRTWPSWLRYDITQPGKSSLWRIKAVYAEPVERNKDAFGMGNKSPWHLYQGRYHLGTEFAWMHMGGSSGAVCATEISRLLASTGVEFDLDCLVKEQSALTRYRKNLDRELDLNSKNQDISQLPSP